MRSYTRLQARLAKLSGIADYTFVVESEGAGEMEDWVVAGIDFANSEEKFMLMSVYIYKFSVGFQRIDLEC